MTHDPLGYGRGVADDYDELYESIPDTEQAVSRLAELANGGSVLELGIGTGRLALPLRERGLAVHGIDASGEMLSKLRDKPGGDELPVTVGDYASASAGESFALVVLALNGIFALETQADQVECFRNASRHLRPGGLMAVEAFVLDHTRLHGGEAVQARYADGERVELQVLRYDAVHQSIDRVNVHLREEGVRLVSVKDRYASPSELDLMAELAGLRRRDRWGGWAGEAFTAASAKHVSVYER